MMFDVPSPAAFPAVGLALSLRERVERTERTRRVREELSI
jgi:hypothetical protein